MYNISSKLDTWVLKDFSKYDNDVLNFKSKISYLRFRYNFDTETNIYFRITFKALSKLKEIKLGIIYNNELYINNKYPNLNKQKDISISEKVKGNVEFIIIVESYKKANIIKLINPLILNLDNLNLSYTPLKLLDKLPYKQNLNYPILHLTNNLLNNYQLLKSQIYKISYDFIKGLNYVYKLKINEINNLGEINIKYGELISYKYQNELILIFKANNHDQLIVEINPYINPFNFKYNINIENQILCQIDNVDINLAKMIEYK